MRADAIDLDIFGTRLRILCDNVEAVVLLQEELRNYVIDEPAPVGFVIQSPHGEHGLHVLLDRAGLVLGRSRSAAQCASMLRSHLGIFLPPPPGTVRVQVRALLYQSTHTVLALAPLLSAPPAVERRIEREHFAMIDRLAIDINSDRALDLSGFRLAGPLVGVEAAGHTGGSPLAANISGIMVPQAGDSVPTRAELITRFAALISPLSAIVDRLGVAEWLTTLSTRYVSLQDRRSLYLALQDFAADFRN